MEAGRLTEIQLYPITLSMELPPCRKGLPAVSHDDDVLRYLAQLSEPFGTKIEICNGVGRIRVGE